MLISGSRSYYDDYLRKKGSGRTLHDPASLLTDRGAYVNFLEVQLERVSAACLSVQAYEERFSDLQLMIKTLESRCTANIKLIALAQQCTEEVRAETDRKFDALAREVAENKQATRRTVDTLDIRLSSMEKALTVLSSLDQRIKGLEQGALDHTAHHSQLEGSLKDQHRAQAEQVMELRANVQDISDEADTLRSTQHRIKYDLEEHKSRTQSAVAQLEDKLTATSQAMQSASSKLEQLDSNVTNQLQAVHHNMETSTADVLTAMQGHYRNLTDELDAVKEGWTQKMDDLKDHLEQEVAEQSNKLSAGWQSRWEELADGQADCHGALASLEEQVMLDMEELQDLYLELIEQVDDHEQWIEEEYERQQQDEKANSKKGAASKGKGLDSRRTSFRSEGRQASFRSSIAAPSPAPVSVAEDEDEEVRPVDENNLFASFRRKSSIGGGIEAALQRRASRQSMHHDQPVERKASVQSLKAVFPVDDAAPNTPQRRASNLKMADLQQGDFPQRRASVQNVQDSLPRRSSMRRASFADLPAAAGAGAGGVADSTEVFQQKMMKFMQKYDADQQLIKEKLQGLPRSPSALTRRPSMGSMESKAISRSNSMQSMAEPKISRKSSAANISIAPVEDERAVKVKKTKLTQRAEGKILKKPVRSSTPPIRATSSSLLRPTVATALKKTTPASSVDLGSHDDLPEYLQRYVSPSTRSSDAGGGAQRKRAWRVNTFSSPQRPSRTAAATAVAVVNLPRISAEVGNRDELEEDAGRTAGGAGKVHMVAEHMVQTSESLFEDDAGGDTVVTTTTSTSVLPK